MIVAVRDPSLAHLLDKVLTVDTIAGEGPAPGFTAVTGRVDDIPGSFDFAKGVQLISWRASPCRCEAFSFPHKRGKRCHNVQQ